MKSKIFALAFIVLVILFSANCFSQSSELNRTANWRFGHAAGLNFDKNNNYQASVFTGSKGVTFEGNSTMSDTLGNLLFYCNGDTLWNALHQPMLNGAGLLSDKNTSTSSQIVPRPGSNTQYFVFVNGCIADQCINGLRYSVVDMTLDNGKGAVVAGQKNILISSYARQGMAVTKHGNGIDYWLASSGYIIPNDKRIVMIPLTSAGPDTLNKVSNSALSSLFGCRFSPNGEMFFNDGILLYKFNKFTGILTDELLVRNDSLNLSTFGYTTYSAEFSPDSKFLYLGLIQGFYPNCFQQYNLSVYDSATISNNIYSWFDDVSAPHPHGLGQMQLAPDGKIYIAKTGGGTDSIHIIHNPNVFGAGCNFEYNALALQRPCNFSMTIFPDYYFNDLKTSIYKPKFDNSNSNIFPNPANDFISIRHKITENYTYILLNNFGEKIAIYIGNNLAKQIHIADYPNGMYYLQILTKNSSITKKIIINH